MLAVNGYFDGQKYVTEHNVAVKPNQRVSITLLDEDFTEGNINVISNLQRCMLAGNKIV